jgi:hypothetical protein
LAASSARSAARLVSSPSQWNGRALLLERAQRLLQRLGEVRPIAIASPTDFIVVVSVGSAAGNFSNAKRGTLTTT